MRFENRQSLVRNMAYNEGNHNELDGYDRMHIISLSYLFKAFGLAHLFFKVLK